MKIIKKILITLIISLSIIFNCNANDINDIKSFTDFLDYGENIPNLNQNIFSLQKFNIMTNDKKFFSKIDSYFWQTLNQMPMNALVEITPLNAKNKFDAIIFLDFRTEKGKFFDAYNNKFLPAEKLFCTVKIFHIFSLRGRILPSKINFKVCDFTVSIKDLNEQRNLRYIAQYLATKIAKTVNNISEMSTDFNPKINLEKNDIKKLPLTSLQLFPIITDFDVKLSKQYRVWYVENLNNFLSLIEETKQQGYKEVYQEGQIINIKNKYNAAQKVIFTKDDKSLTFNVIIINEVNQNYIYFVTYDETLATIDQFKNLIKNYCKDDFINAVKYNFVAINNKNRAHYKEIISFIDLSKEPMSNIRGYIFRSVTGLKKHQKLLNRLWKSYVKKVLYFDDNSMVFPSVIEGFIYDIRAYNKLIADNKIQLLPIDEMSILKDYDNYYDFGKKKQLSFSVAIDDNLTLIRLKYKDQKEYFITLNKLSMANKKPILIFKAIHKNQTEIISSSKNELIRGVDLPVTIKIENIENIDTKITLTLD